MTRSDVTRRRPVLEPTDRISEIVFGLIMATTFTGTLSATAGREDIRTMLIGAIGCNLAWGLVDAVMYVVTTLTERGRNLRFLQQVRATTQSAVAQRLIGETLPEALTRSLQPVEIDRLWAHLQSLPEPPRHPRLGPGRGAIHVLRPGRDGDADVERHRGPHPVSRWPRPGSSCWLPAVADGPGDGGNRGRVGSAYHRTWRMTAGLLTHPTSRRSPLLRSARRQISRVMPLKITR